ncbi:FHA domain-containing protein [Pseudomonas sp. No.117]
MTAAAIELPTTLADALQLAVLEGRHRGVQLPLSRARYRVGAEPGADVVLLDEGVVEGHLELDLTGREVEVRALHGAVQVVQDGVGIRLQAGQGCRLELPVELTLGAARLVLNGPAKPTVAPVRLPWQWGVAAVLMGVCLTTYAMWPAVDAPTTSSVPNAAVPALAVPTPDPRALMQPLLDARQLATIRLGWQDERLTATGVITPAQQPAWIAVQRRFDEVSGGRYPWHDAVRVEALAPPPALAVRAVWFGPSPYVVVDQGKRLVEGAALGDGWTLARIADRQLVLAHGERQLVLDVPRLEARR